MNYIKRLKAENLELKEQIDEARELVLEFRKHLTGPKFHQEKWINIQDVENRLIEINTRLMR